MKIAILVSRFPPEWLAGTEIATYNIARHLAKRGHEVHVITSLDKGMPRESLEQGFYTHRIGCPKVHFLGIVIFWLRVLWLLSRLEPDIVHAQSTMMGLIGFMAKKLLKKPYVVYERGSEVYLPWQFKEPISRLVLKDTDAAIALTNNMKIVMQKIYSRDVYVIPNGVDWHRFEGVAGDRLRSKLQIEEDEKVIIFVGTLRPVKGVKYLIQAMSVIRQEDAKARLVLVGDGEESQTLERLVKELGLEEAIRFVGEVPNEKVPQYMAAADVFVLPSLSESFGIVNLEAMASGLPIVASNVGGLPEIIKDGENGFLVGPGNYTQIAQAVLAILENDGLSQKMAQNNKTKAKQYSWSKTAEAIQEVYMEVLKSR